MFSNNFFVKVLMCLKKFLNHIPKRLNENFVLKVMVVGLKFATVQSIGFLLYLK